MLDDVPALSGPAIGDWVRSLATDVMAPTAVEDVWTTIEAQASRRDDHDRSQQAVPLSVGEYVAPGCVVLVTACLGFLARSGLALDGLECLGGSARCSDSHAGHRAGVASPREGLRLGLDHRSRTPDRRHPDRGSVDEDALNRAPRTSTCPIGHIRVQTSARIPPRCRRRTPCGGLG